MRDTTAKADDETEREMNTARPSRELIASPRHTAIFLAIVAAITLIGIIQASRAAAAGPNAGSRITTYVVLIVVQVWWVRYISMGMKARGHTLAELTGGRYTSFSTFAIDILYAILAFIGAHVAVAAVKAAFGHVAANTAFLLPHGTAESALWLMLSITAGVCEEIVFRGYLQRQLQAMTGYASLAIVLQAMIFGIAHGYQGLPSIAITSTYGLVLGIVAWWRGTIRSGAIAHAATDIVGGLLRW